MSHNPIHSGKDDKKPVITPKEREGLTTEEVFLNLYHFYHHYYS
jgi:hypothetical protein